MLLNSHANENVEFFKTIVGSIQMELEIKNFMGKLSKANSNSGCVIFNGVEDTLIYTIACYKTLAAKKNLCKPNM